MDWLELTITVSSERVEDAAAIANMAVPYGIYIEDYSDLKEGAWEIAHIDLIDEELLSKDTASADIHIYFENGENLNEAKVYLLERLNAEGIEYKVKDDLIREKDWADEWKKYFKCTEVGERFIIRPSWEECEEKDGRNVLTICPGAAFGTGTHATTRLCLEMLEEYVTDGSEMLDIGCGSGILSIGALLLGCKRAVGVDIDPVSVKVAKENAELNEFSGDCLFLEGDLTDKVQGKFDVVCANIVADVVMELSAGVHEFMKEGGVFLCSGIIDMRADEVEETLSRNGFKIVKKLKKDNWRAYAAVLR